jgi:mannose-6-phosphate isomerase-like protein (cupin superfamily)
MSIHQGGRAFKMEAPDAPSFQTLGTLWRVLASGDETGGVVGALDERCGHGIRAPMHVHDDADEIFYILDGDLTFIIGDKRIEAAPGAFIYLPRFVHHSFQVNSHEARVFNFVTPAGFERLILDTGTRAPYDEAPIPDDPQAEHAMPPEALMKKYGMRILPPGSK